MFISVVTEETRLYLFNAYEPFSFNFVLLFIEKTLFITTNLTNSESTSAINIHFDVKTLKILIYKRNLHLTCKPPKVKHQNMT